MWHCDILEKFGTYAIARFVSPQPNGAAPLVRRIQYTLDVATHPVPGQWYDFVKDAETGVESHVPYVPKPKPAPTPPAAAPSTNVPAEVATKPADTGAATAVPEAAPAPAAEPAQAAAAPAVAEAAPAENAAPAAS